MVISDKRYQEIGGMVVLLVAAIVFLSLATFHVNGCRPPFGRKACTQHDRPFGAWTAWFLRSAFGYSSYLISAVCVLAGWEIIRKGSLSSSLERIFSLVYLTVTSSALLALFYPTNVPQFSGGVIGIAIARLFASLLNTTGSCLVIVILNIIGLILLGLFSVDTVLESSGRRHEQVRGVFSSLRARTGKKKKPDVPLNQIGQNIEKRRGEKLPWITRKTIRLYPDDPQPASDPFAERSSFRSTARSTGSADSARCRCRISMRGWPAMKSS
jgi:DNA segregation ATPase FtsK/SpoIIIE-like protein